MDLILDLLICVIVLGLVVYLLQRRLGKNISETAEDYGKVFSDKDVYNLKMILIPLSGCFLMVILWAVVMYGIWEVSEKIITLLVAVILEAVLGFVYIKLCTKAAQDFEGCGKKLFDAVRIYTFAPVILGIGLLLFLLSTGFRIPFFWLIAALMIASFIPVYTNYPALKEEFTKSINANKTSSVSPRTEQPASSETTIPQPTAKKPTKRCPYCGEVILAVAKKCKHCGEWLEKQ